MTEDHDQGQELGNGNLEQATSNTSRVIHTSMPEAERRYDSVEHDLLVQVLDCAKERQELHDKIDQLPEKGQNLNADKEREDLETKLVDVRERMLLIFAQLIESIELDLAAIEKARNVREPRPV